jgi:hypothetical protein
MMTTESPYLSRHLTLNERRKISHALRQLADAARYASNFDPPPEMDAVEVGRLREQIRAEAVDHDRLAGEIERNGLRFSDPVVEDGQTAKGVDR